MLAGTADFDEQMQVLGAQFKQVVIKRGRFGAALADGWRCHQPAGAGRETSLIPTGAGDAFAAGFIAASLAGLPVEECLERGIENGARAVQFVGGQPK